MRDPVEDNQTVDRAWFRSRPKFKEGTTLVYRLHSGDLWTNRSPLTSEEWRSRRPSEWWRIVDGPHPDECRGQFASNTEGLAFPFTAEFEWAVSDHRKFILRRLYDVPAYCRRWLQNWGAGHTRVIAPDRPSLAQQAVEGAFETGGHLIGNGIEIVNLTVSLELPNLIANDVITTSTARIRTEAAMTGAEIHNAVEGKLQRGKLNRVEEEMEYLQKTLYEHGFGGFVVALSRLDAEAAPIVIEQLRGVRDEEVSTLIELAKIQGPGDKDATLSRIQQVIASQKASGSGGANAAELPRSAGED